MQMLLHHTSYTDIIAIGMTGHKGEAGKIHHTKLACIMFLKAILVGQKAGEFSDFSFLAPKNFDSFIDK
jgi:hypothetical protein